MLKFTYLMDFVNLFHLPVVDFLNILLFGLGMHNLMRRWNWIFILLFLLYFLFYSHGFMFYTLAHLKLML